jgi:CRP-like cAMP-binding protein
LGQAKGRPDHLDLNPYLAAKLRVRNKLSSDVAYRVSILKNVHTLAGLTAEELRQACESMEEQKYVKGEDIIKQNDIGDRLFVLQRGSVEVTRKINPKDKNEKPMFLVKLPKDVCFGEIALLTEEPRSATITALEPCICSIMKKKNFDAVVAASNAKSAKQRYLLGKSVVESVPLFRNLSVANKDKLLAFMLPVSYPPGSYICREGSLGNSFFIVLEGACKCTIFDEKENAEKEVAKFGPGSYFGEMCLMDPSSIRNSNVVSLESCSCMSLSRADFNSVLREIKLQELASNAEIYANKKSRKNKKENKRTLKVTGMGPDAAPKIPELMESILSRMTKFVSESLWNSMYAKVFRDVILQPKRIEDYGEILWEIMLNDPNRSESSKLIAEKCVEIGSKPPKERTALEQTLICGMLRQTNKLRTNMCADWHPFQYTDLCKSIQIKVYAPLKTVVEVGTTGTTMYMILRGCARKWNGTARTNLVHSEDLVPGDIFGESAMDGDHFRKQCVRAISELHVAEFEERDFFSAQNRGMEKFSLADKTAFLRKLPLFRKKDDRLINEIAKVLEQQVVSKNKLITYPGMVHQDVVFITEGYAEVVFLKDRNIPEEHVSENSIPFMRVNQGEYYGESGFINNKMPSAKRKQKERHYVVSGSRLSVLILRPQYFHLLDEYVTSSVITNFKLKVQLRNARVQSLGKERKQFNSIKRDMKQIGAALQSVESEDGLESVKSSSRGSRLDRNSMDNASLPSIIGAEEEKSNQSIAPSYFNGEYDIEDIPVYLDGDFDPFMILDACKTDRELKLKSSVVRNIRRPKSVRAKGRSTEGTKDPGFVELSLADSKSNDLEKGGGNVGSEYANERYRLSRSREGNRSISPMKKYSGSQEMVEEESVSLMNVSLPALQMRSVLSVSAASLIGTNPGFSRPTSADSRPGSASSVYLRGSSSIPSSMSYLDSRDTSVRPLSRNAREMQSLTE